MAVTESKRHRVSKKSKKSWRKHTDIKDVDEFLDEVRLEERLGQPFADRPDEDLFYIDTAGTENKESGTQCAKSSHVGARKSLRAKPIDNPKCFSILTARSAVPDPIKKRNRVRTPEERKNKLLKWKEEYRKVNGILTKKEVKAEENRKRNEEERQKKQNPGDPFHKDIWSEKQDLRNLDGHAYWLRKETVSHTLQNTGHKSKMIPRNILKKTSVLAKVEAPHPGSSYNPSIDDHSELLHNVADKEVGLIKEEKHLKRVTTDMFSKVSARQDEKNWIKEMSGGLNEEHHDDDLPSGDEYKTVNPPVKNKKKTLKQRRKKKEAIKEKELLKRKKINKKKAADLHRLAVINEKIAKRNEKLVKVAEERKQKQALKVLKTKKLSKVKFEDVEPEFNMPSEIGGSLVGLKKEGNLLLDRYKSLQKRNIIEPGLKRFPKKIKMKKYEKATHKMGWESKGYEVN